jgi:hypothetical protein
MRIGSNFKILLLALYWLLILHKTKILRVKVFNMSQLLYHQCMRLLSSDFPILRVGSQCAVLSILLGRAMGLEVIMSSVVLSSCVWCLLHFHSCWGIIIRNNHYYIVTNVIFLLADINCNNCNARVQWQIQYLLMNTKRIQISFLLVVRVQLIHSHSRNQQKNVNQCCKWLKNSLLIHGTVAVMKSSS